jgi:hypothetical protein
MLIMSGIKPDGTGVGRLMACLVQEAAARPAGDVRILCRPSWQKPLDLLCRGRFGESLAVWRGEQEWQRLLPDPSIRNADPLVLIQPQTLGVSWCQRLIESRRLPTWLYLLDSSFFCLRSYNHIDGEHAACTRCLGGRWQWASQLGCQPWPIADAGTSRFVERLRDWIIARKVRCLVQNERQAELIRTHCSGRAEIQVVGLWTADLDTSVPRPLPSKANAATPAKVVFHGVSIAAKGAAWTVEVARHCPQLTFLFPFKQRQLKLARGDVPGNVQFAPLTWETGLADEVATAAVTLVPSLWSATLEGALLKSIIAARAVAVVDEPTAYSSELPAGLVLRLANDPCQAAQQLTTAALQRWTPDARLHARWIAQLDRANRNLLARLITACQSGAGEQSASPNAA